MSWDEDEAEDEDEDEDEGAPQSRPRRRSYLPLGRSSAGGSSRMKGFEHCPSLAASRTRAAGPLPPAEARSSGRDRIGRDRIEKDARPPCLCPKRRSASPDSTTGGPAPTVDSHASGVPSGAHARGRARRYKGIGPHPSALTRRPGPGSSAGSSPAPALSAASPARRWGGLPTLCPPLSPPSALPSPLPSPLPPPTQWPTSHHSPALRACTPYV